jgi:YkoY family integral membrane protein
MPHFPSLLADFNIFGQTVAASDLAVVLLLVVLEGVLSIDNALVLGLLAKRLPAHLRKRALTYGLIGAFVFRVVAICTASLLLRWTFVKFLGGAYLVYIAVKHMFFESHEESDDKIALDDQGNPVLQDEAGKDLTPAREELEIQERVPVDIAESRTGRNFWYTVAVIELTDVAFAVDSILAAMALAGSKQDKLWVVITGGILGVILMRFAAVVFIRLLEKFPRFDLAAYLLVLVIGAKLLADWGLNSDWSFQQTPTVAKSLGTWQPRFQAIEEQRRGLIKDYEGWLDEHWIFKLPHQDLEEHQEPEPEEPGKMKLPHVPHLLDFHDVRRPESMAFWAIMVACFCVGFWKPRKK